MKNIKEYIVEASNKEAMFLHKDGIRTSEGFTFNQGEKVLMIKYSTHHYEAQLRGVYNVKKVNKNNISIESSNDYEANLKFDKTGIAVIKQKNKYLGNSTDYWVLYNKELIDDEDIKELLNDGHCSWHFGFVDTRKNEYIKELKKYIKEVNN